MKKEIVWKISVIVLLVMNTLTIGYLLFSTQGKKEARPAPPDQLIIQGLHLDANQIEAFQVIKREHRNQLDSLENLEKTVRQNLFLEIQKGEGNELNEQALLIELNKLRSSRDIATLEHLKKIYLLCREEQKPYYKATIEEISRVLMRPRGPQH